MKEEKPKHEITSNAVELSYKGINTMGKDGCLGVRGKGKQAKSESFLLPCLYIGGYQKVWPGFGDPPQVIQSRKSFTGICNCLGFS